MSRFISIHKQRKSSNESIYKILDEQEQKIKELETIILNDAIDKEIMHLFLKHLNLQESFKAYKKGYLEGIKKIGH